MTIAAAQLAMTGSAGAQSLRLDRSTSFVSVKQVNAGLLNVGYAEAGPPDRPAVVLLHGWSYDTGRHDFSATPRRGPGNRGPLLGGGARL
jgi:hypothetical protein